MSKKSNSIPDSDQSERGVHNQTDQTETDSQILDGGQTSNKTGKHSATEKLAASRPEFGSSPGNNPVDGAFGDTHKNGPEVHSEKNPRDKALRPKL